MMKNKLLLFTLIGILFFSCNPRENIVTFHLDNEISKQLLLNASLGETATNSVYSEEEVDLLESETFRKYIRNIVELEVTSVDITIVGYDQGIRNATIQLGSSLSFQNLPLANGTFTVSDSQLLNTISAELLQEQIISFSFEGEAIAEDTFNISLSLSLKGVFTD